MKYSQGSIGRIFLVKFEHEDDLLGEIEELARKEDIACATIALLGALVKGDIVTGPEKVEVPATPNWMSFSDVWEVIGFGTITRGGDGKVKTHLHGSFGKGEKALTGCLRNGSDVFITVEAIVTELKDIPVTRKKDEKTGHELLTFE